MAKFNQSAKVQSASSTSEANVLSQFVADIKASVNTEGAPMLQDSPVYFRDLKGQEHNFKGINYLEAVVQSPLVEEGSGQLLCHPETTRTFAVKTKVRTTLPGNRLGEEKLREKIRVAEGLVVYGQPVIQLATILPEGGVKYSTLEKWDEIMPGLVQSHSVVWNEETELMAVTVDCLLLMSGDNEKYRGFGKARGNGGFLRNVEVVSSTNGKTVFNPNQPLKVDGKLVQVEHVVGAEEYKVLNYLIGMVAHEVGKIVWNSLTGHWEGVTKQGEKLDEAGLLDLIGKKAKRVEVTRKWLDPEVYQMFKDLYDKGGKWYVEGDFTFTDETYSIVHHQAPCWIGIQTQIIECPLTLSFMGKTSMFAEHIGFLGTEYPALFGQLMESVKRNAEPLTKLFDMAMGIIPGVTNVNPSGNALILDPNTLIKQGEKWELKKSVTETGGMVIEDLTIPAGTEYNPKFARELGQKLEKMGYPAIIFESFSSTDEVGVVCLYLEGFVGMTGDVAHKAFKNFSLLLQMLEVDLDERDHNWDSEFYRVVRMLQGAIEFLVADSNSLIAKASKTEKVLLTARRMGTLDGSVKRDEMHAHPAFLEMFGIIPHYTVGLKEDGQRYTKDHLDALGDWTTNGRVPVPGSSTQKWVANWSVPFGVVLQLASVVKEQDQGDHDGDSGVSIVMDCQGNLKPIKAGRNVNPIAD